MGFVDIDEEIQRVQSIDWGKAVEILEMIDNFPDLRLFRDDWGGIHYCSKSINPNATWTEVEYCCCKLCQELQPVRFWAFSVIEPSGTRIYSDPPFITVSHQNTQGFGELPTKEWEQELDVNGFPLSITVDVREHLSARPPVNYFGDEPSGPKPERLNNQAIIEETNI